MKKSAVEACNARLSSTETLVPEPDHKLGDDEFSVSAIVTFEFLAAIGIDRQKGDVRLHNEQLRQVY